MHFLIVGFDRPSANQKDRVLCLLHMIENIICAMWTMPLPPFQYPSSINPVIIIIIVISFAACWPLSLAISIIVISLGIVLLLLIIIIITPVIIIIILASLWVHASRTFTLSFLATLAFTLSSFAANASMKITRWIRPRTTAFPDASHCELKRQGIIQGVSWRMSKQTDSHNKDCGKEYASVQVMHCMRPSAEDTTRQHSLAPHWTPRQGIQKPPHLDGLRCRLCEWVCSGGTKRNCEQLTFRADSIVVVFSKATTMVFSTMSGTKSEKTYKRLVVSHRLNSN